MAKEKKPRTYKLAEDVKGPIGTGMGHSDEILKKDPKERTLGEIHQLESMVKSGILEADGDELDLGDPARMTSKQAAWKPYSDDPKPSDTDFGPVPVVAAPKVEKEKK